MNEEITQRAKAIIEKLDLSGKLELKKKLEDQMLNPGFWQDHQAAGKVSKQLAQLQKDIEQIEFFKLLLDDGDAHAIEDEVKKLEFSLYLSGQYDRGNAIVSLHAGQGGTEAMDWTEILYRMYSRYIERKGWHALVIDETKGEEAGIKSITLTVTGSFAYGFLKAERGVHRLVRQSPFNADNLRQTSFAMVEVLPDIEDDVTKTIKEDELEWEFYRSGGKGGQNVNKVSTAVRLRHLPTGIVVTSQSERYQGQNREFALKLLKAKLWEREEEERLKTEKSLRGEYKTPGWGNQIRSYVLHPYRLVKDVRTQYETNNSDRVLDGDIEDFILAYLKNTV